MTRVLMENGTEREVPEFSLEVRSDGRVWYHMLYNFVTIINPQEIIGTLTVSLQASLERFGFLPYSIDYWARKKLAIELIEGNTEFSDDIKAICRGDENLIRRCLQQEDFLLYMSGGWAAIKLEERMLRIAANVGVDIEAAKEKWLNMPNSHQLNSYLWGVVQPQIVQTWRALYGEDMKRIRRWTLDGEIAASFPIAGVTYSFPNTGNWELLLDEHDNLLPPMEIPYVKNAVGRELLKFVEEVNPSGFEPVVVPANKKLKATLKENGVSDLNVVITELTCPKVQFPQSERWGVRDAWAYVASGEARAYVISYIAKNTAPERVMIAIYHAPDENGKRRIRFTPMYGHYPTNVMENRLTTLIRILAPEWVPVYVPEMGEENS